VKWVSKSVSLSVLLMKWISKPVSHFSETDFNIRLVKISLNGARSPEDLVQLVKVRVEERNLSELLLDETGLCSWSFFSSSCSSDEDSCSGKNWKLGGYSGRVGRRFEAMVCYRWSSLVAVMIQALVHRVSYVWVVEVDGTLMGIVSFQAMLKVFREHLKSMC